MFLATLIFFGSLLASSEASNGDAGAVKCWYRAKPSALIVDVREWYAGRNESYEVSTPFGVASVKSGLAMFQLYPGYITGPEGFALALISPKKLPIHLQITQGPTFLEFLNVDSRKVDMDYLKFKPYR